MSPAPHVVVIGAGTLGLFTAVTGVSGGGKSTLLIDTLYKAIARRNRSPRVRAAARSVSWERSSPMPST